MYRFFLKLKKNNKGSTMIIVLVAIAFVGILAAVVTTTTVTGYKLRTMDYKSKKTFYSAESALEEIYTGLAEKCYSVLETAYNKTISNLDGKTNAEANDELRTYYLNAVEGLCDWKNSDSVTDYLNGFLTRPEYASVLSADASATIKAGKIKVPDVVVQYLEKKSSDFSTVAVDVVIDYPDITFNFVNDMNNLKSYLDFSMVGMQGITVSASSSTVSGGVFAGNRYTAAAANGGLVISSGAKLNVEEQSANVKSILIAQSKIAVNGTMNVTGASTEKNAVSLWTENLTVGQTAGHGSYSSDITGSLNMGLGYIETHLSDDLTIWGNGSNATLASKFYGYGNGAVSSRDSSAIIINGINSKLNATGLSNLSLNGNSWISLNGSEENMTYDSIGIKGTQSIYLVPSEYMNVSNPCASTTDISNAIDTEKLSKSSIAGFLNGSMMYSVKQDNGYYFYLNFASVAAQNNYIQTILSTGGIANETVGTEKEREYKKILNRLYKIIDNGTKKYVSSIQYNKNAGSVFTYGVMYDVNSSTNVKDTTSYANKVGPKLFCSNTNRFNCFVQFLYDTDTEDDGYVTKDNTLIANGEQISILNADGTVDVHEYNENNNYYDYVLDKTRLEKASTRVEVDSKKHIAAILCDDNWDGNAATSYKLSEIKAKYGDFTGGVIVGYFTKDIHIIVDCPFEGIIITNNKIDVDTGASTIKANHDLVDSVIANKDGTFASGFLSNFFFAYQGQNSELNPENISLQDLVNFTDWRKNYEVAYKEETE